MSIDRLFGESVEVGLVSRLESGLRGGLGTHRVLSRLFNCPLILLLKDWADALISLSNFLEDFVGKSVRVLVWMEHLCQLLVVLMQRVECPKTLHAFNDDVLRRQGKLVDEVNFLVIHLRIRCHIKNSLILCLCVDINLKHLQVFR